MPLQTRQWRHRSSRARSFPTTLLANRYFESSNPTKDVLKGLTLTSDNRRVQVPYIREWNRPWSILQWHPSKKCSFALIWKKKGNPEKKPGIVKKFMKRTECVRTQSRDLWSPCNEVHPGHRTPNAYETWFYFLLLNKSHVKSLTHIGTTQIFVRGQVKPTHNVCYDSVSFVVAYFCG